MRALLIAVISFFSLAASFSGASHAFGYDCLAGPCPESCACAASIPTQTGPDLPDCISKEMVFPGPKQPGCCETEEPSDCEDSKPCVFVGGTFKLTNNGCCDGGDIEVFTALGWVTIPNESVVTIQWPATPVNCNDVGTDDEAAGRCKTTQQELWRGWATLVCSQCSEISGN